MNITLQATIEQSKSLLLAARNAYFVSDYDQAESCSREVVAMLEPHAKRRDIGIESDVGTQKYELIDLLAHAYNRLNTIAVAHSDFPLALNYAQTAISYAERINDKKRIAGVLSNNGIIHTKRGDYPLAMECITKSLQLNEETGGREAMARDFRNIAGIYQALSDTANALMYCKKSLAIWEELGEKSGIAETLCNIGIIHADSAEPMVALEYLHSALTLNRELGVRRAIGRNLNSIAVVYIDLKEYGSALEYLQQALSIFEELGVMEGIAISIENIGSIYANPDYDGYSPTKGEEYLLRSVALHLKLGTKNYERDNHQALALLYKNTQQWEQACHHLERQYALQQEIDIEKAQKQVEQLEWERKIAEMEKEREIDRIRLHAEKENILRQAEVQAQEVQNTIQALVKKNALLKQIQADIQKIMPHTRKEAYVYITQLSDRIERNIILFDSQQGTESHSTEHQEQFIATLQSAFAHLSSMELKVAALLNMKMTSSSIAAALFLSKRTVEYHRRNLRKKMGLSAKEDIYLALAAYAGH